MNVFLNDCQNFDILRTTEHSCSEYSNQKLGENVKRVRKRGLKHLNRLSENKNVKNGETEPNISHNKMSYAK